MGTSSRRVLPSDKFIEYFAIKLQVRSQMANKIDYIHIGEMALVMENAEPRRLRKGCHNDCPSGGTRRTPELGTHLRPTPTYGTPQCTITPVSRYLDTYAAPNLGLKGMDHNPRTIIQSETPKGAKTGNPRGPVYSDLLWSSRGHVGTAVPGE
ncbi:hypothetical protein MHU86_20731 [Fragilaria crotonensis]|nr:hypothetical protein MHU86_20731 [Fragilaria crotonensis]